MEVFVQSFSVRSLEGGNIEGNGGTVVGMLAEEIMATEMILG